MITRKPHSLVLGGIIRFTAVMTMLNNTTNFGLYSAPTLSPAISDKHLSVTLRKSGTSRNCDGRDVNTYDK